jgi:hypothetical protein
VRILNPEFFAMGFYVLQGSYLHAGSNLISSDTFHCLPGSVALTSANQHMQNIWCMIWPKRLIQYLWQDTFIFEAFTDPSLDAILAWEEGA